nr:hypothetical protein [Tanacetum cinerariifolium]
MIAQHQFIWRLANGNVSDEHVGPSNVVKQDYMGVMSRHFLSQYPAIFGARGKGMWFRGCGCGSEGVVGLSNTIHWNETLIARHQFIWRLANSNVSDEHVGLSNVVKQDYMGVMSRHFLSQYPAIFGARGKGIMS